MMGLGQPRMGHKVRSHPNDISKDVLSGEIMPYADPVRGKEYQKLYYIANREKRLMQSRQWWENNHEQSNERNRYWYQNNHEQELERKRQWRKDNHEYHQQYYISNRENMLAQNRRYYVDNCEEILQQGREWRKNNPDKVQSKSQRRRALKAKAAIEIITQEQLIALRWIQKERCIYCERDLKGGGHLDHMTPLSRKGKHCFDNVQWTCEGCNLSKGASTDEEYREWLGRKQAA
jgi:hypothetical protein